METVQVLSSAGTRWWRASNTRIFRALYRTCCWIRNWMLNLSRKQSFLLWMKMKRPSTWTVTRSIWKTLKPVWRISKNFRNGKPGNRLGKSHCYPNKRPNCKADWCRIAANWLPLSAKPKVSFPNGKRNKTARMPTKENWYAGNRSFRMNRANAATSYRKRWQCWTTNCKRH